MRSGTRLALLLLPLCFIGAKPADKGLATSGGSTGSPTAEVPELVVQSGHSSKVAGIEFSPNQKKFITYSWDATARIWTSTGKLMHILEGAKSALMVGAIAPNGTIFISGSAQGELVCWNLQGKRLFIINAHETEIKSIAFSPDSSMFITADRYGTARLWSSAGKPLRKYSLESKDQSGRFSAVFSPSGKQILTVSPHPIVRLWDLKGNLVKTFEYKPAYWAESATFAPDGRKVLIGYYKAAVIFDIYSGDLQALDVSRGVFEAGDYNSRIGFMSKVMYSKNGQRIAIESTEAGRYKANRTLLFASDGKLLEVLPEAQSAFFSPNGERIFLVTGTAETDIKIYNSDGKLDKNVNFPPRHRLFNGAGRISPDEKLILFHDPTGGRTVQFWMPKQDSFGYLGRGIPQDMHENGQQKIISYSFLLPLRQELQLKPIEASSVRQININSDVRTLKVENIEGSPILSIPHTSDILDAVISENSARIVSYTKDRWLRLFDLTGKLLHSIEINNSNENPQIHMRISSDGKRILLWDTAMILFDEELKPVKNIGTGFFRETRFLPDSRKFVVVSQVAGKIDIRLFDHLGNKLAELSDFSAPSDLNYVNFSHDGEKILFISNQYSLLSVTDFTGKLIAKISTARSWSTLISSRLVLSIADGAINLWSSNTGKHLGTFMAFRQGGDTQVIKNSSNREADPFFYTPDGRFDYTDKRALEYVSYRVGEKFVDLQEVHDYYYTPGLLKMVLDDTLPANETGDLNNKLKKLPDIRILEPNPEGAQDKIMERKIKFSFLVKDKGGGVAKAAVRVKGKLVWESPAGTDLKDMQEIDLTLDGGLNQVSVTAYNRAGGPHTETVDLRCADVDLKKQSKLFILSVGVNEYSQNALSYSVADAKKVMENFEKQSKPFFKEVIPIALYDKDATLGRIQKEIRSIQEKAGADDVVMLYFSGHGLSVKEESGKKLFGFIPQDYPWRGDEATTLRRFGLTHDYLAAQVKLMKPTKVVIIMDACHSGDAQLAFARSAENNDREILEKLANGTGVFMLTSSAGKQLSREEPSIGHGVFTYVLLEGLADKDADSNGDGAVSIKELSGYMTARFESRAQKIMGKNFVQTPVINSMGRSEASAAALDFPLARVR